MTRVALHARNSANDRSAGSTDEQLRTGHEQPAPDDGRCSDLPLECVRHARASVSATKLRAWRFPELGLDLDAAKAGEAVDRHEAAAC